MKKINNVFCALACSITMHTTTMEQNTQKAESSSMSPWFHYSGSFCMGFMGYDLVSIARLRRALREDGDHLQHLLLQKTKLRAGFVGLLGAALLSAEQVLKRNKKESHH